MVAAYLLGGDSLARGQVGLSHLREGAAAASRVLGKGRADAEARPAGWRGAGWGQMEPGCPPPG